MNEDFLTPLGGRARLHQAFQGLREQLQDILPVGPEEITPTQRFDRLIPRAERRLVWQELRHAGFPLPQLRLPSPVFLIVALVILAPVAFLVFLFNWSFVFSLAELSLVARTLTRPWAVEPPRDCQTVQKAVLHITPFLRKDYEAGLWPRQALAAKVRWIVAEAAGLSLESVKEETRLNDILGC